MQRLLVALRQTTADDQQLAAPVGFMVGHLQDGIDRFFLGVVDECAGVDDNNVGLTFVGDDRITILRQMSEHDLGVDEIFRAAEADQTDI